MSGSVCCWLAEGLALQLSEVREAQLQLGQLWAAHTSDAKSACFGGFWEKYDYRGAEGLLNFSRFWGNSGRVLSGGQIKQRNSHLASNPVWQAWESREILGRTPLLSGRDSINSSPKVSERVPVAGRHPPGTFLKYQKLALISGMDVGAEQLSLSWAVEPHFPARLCCLKFEISFQPATTRRSNRHPLRLACLPACHAHLSAGNGELMSRTTPTDPHWAA